MEKANPSWESFDIAGRNCQLLRRGRGGPVFLWAFYPHEGNELEDFRRALEQALPDTACTVGAFEVDDWNRDLSPWEAAAAVGEERFGGKGSDTQKWLTEEYQPWLRKHCPDSHKHYLIGYSLAGLFALWSLYETDRFDGAACCSGSLWLDGWDTYAAGHRMKAPADVYLSLGGKEERTKNPVMALVGGRTRQQEKLLRRDPLVRHCFLEWNPGGHFADSAGRLAKGAAWLCRYSLSLQDGTGTRGS